MIIEFGNDETTNFTIPPSTPHPKNRGGSI
jgi:hypothetical protein